MSTDTFGPLSKAEELLAKLYEANRLALGADSGRRAISNYARILDKCIRYGQRLAKRAG